MQLISRYDGSRAIPLCVLFADRIIARPNGRRRSSARFCEIIDDFLAEREGAALGFWRLPSTHS